jgi:hypothetical protein
VGNGMLLKQKSHWLNSSKAGKIRDLASISYFSFRQSNGKASQQGLVSGGLRKPLKINSLLFTNSVQKLWITLKEAPQMLTK